MASRAASCLIAVAALVLTACSSTVGDSTPSSSTPAAASTTPNGIEFIPATPAATPAPRSSTAASPTTSGRSSKSTASPSDTTPKAQRSTRLPLDLETGNAKQVVTVVSDGSSDTTATVQRWARDGSRWRKVGGAVDGYVGSGGIGKASEGSSKTPAGSFTLTEAFGRDADPGTRLPYVRTTDADYWISSPGPKYNTRQRCGDCGYDNGVNEHLREITPEYDHAVVIDYNTANAPGGVKPGQGSAFFLHIENGEPTAGCVAIARSDLTTVLRWLRPSAHPRILIGVR